MNKGENMVDLVRWPREDRPKPGSDAAVAAGCVCPVIDNGYGSGYRGNAKAFIYSIGCPLHYPVLVRTILSQPNDEGEGK